MKLDELQRICQQATPGPWAAGIFCGDDPRNIFSICRGSLEGGDFQMVTSGSFDAERPEGILCEADAAFIATFNPALVAKLLRVAETAQVEALRWTESLCNRAEAEKRDEAWAELDSALSALGLGAP